ncbi:MAG: hypothetical protein V3S91_02030, partial [Gemmatimonadota bacterium]
ASDERIEAYLLYYMKCGVGPEENAEGGPRPSAPTAEIVSFRTFIEDGGARLRQLFFRLLAKGMGTFRFPKVHPAEISEEFLETLGFRAAAAHRLYAATARPG